MSDIVIRADGLGKKYLIGHQAANERYTALRDVAARTARGLVRSARDLMLGRQLVAGDELEEFWALKDINFEIKRGEVVGIIGRNGAGKSTLLKVLSRITEPSVGRVEIRGRVASLLEVGTGFHPELTGRENIFLNGAILGMSRAEIKRKFDEIVAFAEVERFLDTPVKRYSSGMYVRLAFAVAAHLEPEILIVDEVLAVGDAEFQQKCLGKMREVADGQGRTVLFVSHNIGALQTICQNAVLLDAGRLVAQDDIQAVVQKYQTRARTHEPKNWNSRFFGPLKSVLFDEIVLNGQPLLDYTAVQPENELHFVVSGRALSDLSSYRFAAGLLLNGQRILSLHDGPSSLTAGPFQIGFSLPAYYLRPGTYSLALGGKRTATNDWTWGEDLATIELLPKWDKFYDHDDQGILNLPNRIKRLSIQEICSRSIYRAPL